MRCHRGLFFLAAFGGSAVLGLQPQKNPQEKVVPVLVPTHNGVPTTSKKSDEDVAEAKKKLEAVVAGLSKIASTGNLGHSALKDSLISPFVDQVSTILKTVKAGKLTASEKKKKIEEANKSMENLAVGMAKRGEELLKEESDDKTNLLMGVLLSRKDRSLEEQYTVLEDAEFSNLDVVAYVKAEKGKDHRALVEQCGEFLDHPKELSKEEKAANKKETAIKGLQVKIMSMAKKLKEGKQTGHMSHVQQALTAEAIKHMQQALKAVKADDKKAMAVAEGKMMDTLKEMQEGYKKMREEVNNSMIVLLLQTGTGTAEDAVLRRDCPYCKAQCFEKCHDGGKTYTECLQKCADPESTGEKFFF